MTVKYLPKIESGTLVIRFGPFLDADGFTPYETSVPSSQILISKDNGAYASKNDATNTVHDRKGFHTLTLNSTDLNTLGVFNLLWESPPPNGSSHAPLFDEYQVIPKTDYDHWKTTGQLPVNRKISYQDVVDDSTVTPTINSFALLNGSTGDDYYNGQKVIVKYANGKSFSTTVSNYVGASKTITTSDNMPSAPSDGDFITLEDVDPYLVDIQNQITSKLDVVLSTVRDTILKYSEEGFATTVDTSFPPTSTQFKIANGNPNNNTYLNQEVLVKIGDYNKFANISGYDGTTKILTLDSAMPTLTNGMQVLIRPRRLANLNDIPNTTLYDTFSKKLADRSINIIASSPAPTTTVFALTSGYSSTSDDVYNGMLIHINSNQTTLVGEILDYVGSTRTITLKKPLSEAPVGGSDATLMQISPADLVDGSISKDTYDNVTAFAVEDADAGNTYLGRTGAGNENLETIRTAIDEIPSSVSTEIAPSKYNGVWYDNVHGESGINITAGIGLEGRPIDNLDDVFATASFLQIRKIMIASGTATILDRDVDRWRIEGHGSILDFNNHEIYGSFFKTCIITGTAISVGGYIPHFENCSFLSCILPPCNIIKSGFLGNITLNVAGSYVWDSCYAGNSESIIPEITLSPNVELKIGHYSGNIIFKNMDSTNKITLEGYGHVIIDSSCVGGELTVSGNFKCTDQTDTGLGTELDMIDIQANVSINAIKETLIKAVAGEVDDASVMGYLKFVTAGILGKMIAEEDAVTGEVIATFEPPLHENDGTTKYKTKTVKSQNGGNSVITRTLEEPTPLP